ncbi:MAG TPA: pentapeptide repeat-containing protein [Anseongella sp.]|nr:pentapeptide repeat-containing protein [Anseongella sp.]
MQTNKIWKLALPALLFVLPAAAQKTVSSAQIIRKINQGEAVEISNAVIQGALDLTELDNKAPETGKGNSSEAYKSKVNVPLVFRNCSFEGDVIAYKVLKTNGKRKKLLEWDSDSQVLYTADFSRRVIFEGCTFRGLSEFKYSGFSGEVSFSGADFSAPANFKYAHFSDRADFSEAAFGDGADFKYAQFQEEANFSSARMMDDASFKYAGFRKNVDFQHTSFQGFADFKYTSFKQATDFHETSFRKGSDFKYTSGDYRL